MHLSAGQDIPIAAVGLRQHDERAADGGVGGKPGLRLGAVRVTIEAAAGHDDHRRGLVGVNVTAFGQAAGAGAGDDLHRPRPDAQAADGADGIEDQAAVHDADARGVGHLAQLALQLQLLAAQAGVEAPGKIKRVAQQTAFLVVGGVVELDKEIGVGQAHGIGNRLPGRRQHGAADQAAQLQIGGLVNGVHFQRMADHLLRVGLEDRQLGGGQGNTVVGRGPRQAGLLRNGDLLLVILQVAAEAGRRRIVLVERRIAAVIGRAIGRWGVLLAAAACAAAPAAAATAAAHRLFLRFVDDLEDGIHGLGCLHQAVNERNVLITAGDAQHRVEQGRSLELETELAPNFQVELAKHAQLIRGFVGFELESKDGRQLRAQEPEARNAEANLGFALEGLRDRLEAKSHELGDFLERVGVGFELIFGRLQRGP